MAMTPVEVRTPSRDSDTRRLAEELLSPAAQEFLTRLHREVEPTRHGLLETRQQRWAELRRTGKLTFPAETRSTSAPRIGASRMLRTTCRSARSRSPGRRIARWS